MKVRHTHALAQARSRGVTLVFALIALAVLSLAAVGLVRSVNTNALVLGNLAFKADSAAFSDRGSEAAIAWLLAQASATRTIDVASSGYYATSRDALDPLGNATGNAARALVDWHGDGCVSQGVHASCLTPSAAVDIGNNQQYRFIITRLCTAAEDVESATNSCAMSLSQNQLKDSAHNSLDTSNPRGLDISARMPMYRIIVRAVGGRNAVTVTETIVRL